MSLSDLASIAIIAQGVFFIVSIILVWYQLRENTKLVRAANTQKLVELFAPFNLQLAQDRELAELWACGSRGEQGLNELDKIDRDRYFNLLTWWLMMHENTYHQWSKRLIDEDTYKSWTRDLEYFARQQNLANSWDRFGDYFEESFARHVAEIIASQAEKAG